MIQSFSGYSFCKPHSASYAMLSFTCAYLKAHFPAEFLAAVIANQGGFYSPYAYLSEARRFGIHIMPPHINRSFREYRGRKDRIRMGFMAIRNLQAKAIDTILNERKSGDFVSLADFLARVDIDLSDAMALTNAGCFAELEPEITHKDIAFRAAHFYLQNESREPLTVPTLTGNLSRQEKRKLEIETFGFPISEHPLLNYLPYLGTHIKKAKDIHLYKGKTIALAGIAITRKITSTRNRQPMEFVTFEDETDLYECVMFPETYKTFGDLLNWETLFLIQGKVEEAYSVYTVTIEKLISLTQMIKRIKETKTVLTESLPQ
ncbi:DNA polymerase III alpha subunit [hydrothermal vent metagenome]|uniref:DNA polymerase III alpha subunit n=1 Tax=hydrothermal vent metagenome TaxID=652676 RepID=A0A160VF52_9ZZZZ